MMLSPIPLSARPMLVFVVVMLVCGAIGAPVSELNVEEIEVKDNGARVERDVTVEKSSEMKSDHLAEEREEDSARADTARLEEDDEERMTEQQQPPPCIPQVEGQRCTFDICGDPAGIIRNCCQQFCGGGILPSSPSPLMFAVELEEW